jgi:hypothetical protein
MSRELGGEQYKRKYNCTLYLAAKNVNIDVKNTDIYVKYERNVRPFPYDSVSGIYLKMEPF